MRLIVAILLVLLFCTTPSQAADDLSRKPGLWEVKTSIDRANAPARVVQQCIDAATDQMLQSIAGPFNPAACPKRNVQHKADETTIDFKCNVAGKPATAHSVLTGSLDSAYRLAVTAENENIANGKMVMTMDGKWLGPCPADQKTGDVSFGNGTKVNILEMQKRSLSNLPLAPQ